MRWLPQADHCSSSGCGLQRALNEKNKIDRESRPPPPSEKGNKMHSRQVCLGRPHRTRPRLEHRRRREVRAPIRQNTHHVVSLIGIKKTIVVRASQCQDDAFRRRYAAPVTLVSSVDNLSSLRYARLVIGMWSSTWLCPRNMHDRVKGATANVPAGKKKARASVMPRHLASLRHTVRHERTPEEVANYSQNLQ